MWEIDISDAGFLPDSTQNISFWISTEELNITKSALKDNQIAIYSSPYIIKITQSGPFHKNCRCICHAE